MVEGNLDEGIRAGGYIIASRWDSQVILMDRLWGDEADSSFFSKLKR